MLFRKMLASRNGCVVLIMLLSIFLMGHSQSWMNYGFVSGVTDVTCVKSKNFTTVNAPQPSLANVTHPEFLSVFPFPRSPVVVVDCQLDDPVKWIALKKPVLLKRCQFFNQAFKWDLHYLSKELTDEYGVSISNSRKFLYYDAIVNYENYEKSGWRPPYRIQYNSFGEFLDVASELFRVNNGTHAYFQTLLHNEDRNTSVKSDLNSFDYSWLLGVAFELGWSTNVLNMLFVGMPDVVTPLHYDIMENLFIQVKGKKRFILFSPDQFTNLYPYPVGHPHDRQSQVDLDLPDYERFPKFSKAQAQEAILEPGDVLYVPTNWWHHVEANKNIFTVSLNFWIDDELPQRIFTKIKDSSSSGNPSILTPAEDLAFKRHVETIVYNMTKSSEKVREIFEDLLNGRYEV